MTVVKPLIMPARWTSRCSREARSKAKTQYAACTPVEQRAPVDEVSVLHLLEGVLDLGLAAVGRDNLLIGPFQVV